MEGHTHPRVTAAALNQNVNSGKYMKVLICNAGSSSLKFSLFEAMAETLLADGTLDWATTPARLTFRIQDGPKQQKEVTLRGHAEAMTRLLQELRSGAAAELGGTGGIEAVGHRIVHGGPNYTQAVLITPEVQRALSDLAELAPLHNKAGSEVIQVVTENLPGVPQVAAFDTAFHATLPEPARTYPIPQKWTREWGLRRYGFHGLSHAYCTRRATELLGRANLRLIIAHLGNGASVSAVANGICQDTSMGFTPMEGLMMGTRSGSVDPGLLIYLLREKGLNVEQLDHALNYESGLLGVSALSADMRQLLGAQGQNPDARLAIEIYVHRLQQTIGALAATLGGVDALVFTAGVGENSAEIRARVCANLDYLGLKLDRGANTKGKTDQDIAALDSPGRILVIATREDLTILREMKILLQELPLAEQFAARVGPENTGKRHKS